MNKTTLFGRLLSEIRFERLRAKEATVNDIWKRNGLANPKLRACYRMAETSTVSQDGTEVTEYRLYKLVDRSLVTVSADISVKVENGVTITENNDEG